jgi:hypothetical protein
MPISEALTHLETPLTTNKEKEIVWAKKQSRTAMFSILAPFLLALAFLIVLRFDSIRHLPPSFRLDFSKETLSAELRTVAQATLVLAYPGLFLSLVWNARRTIKKHAIDGQQAFETFDDEIQYRRSRRYLAEEGRPLFWRRFGFALVLVFGSDFWLDGLLHFPSATGLSSAAFPTEVAGIAGFFIYTTTVFIQQYRTGSLNNRVLVSLFNRAIIVIIICGVIQLAESELRGSFLLLSGAFFAGMFPDTGLVAIAKLTKVNIERFTIDPSSGFRQLPEVDLWKETALVDLGITGVADLANTDLRQLIVSCSINAGVLLYAADHALLLHTFSVSALVPAAGGASASEPDFASKLKKLPVFTASELVLFLLGSDAFPPALGVAGATPNRQLVGPLTSTEKGERKQQVEKALGVENVAVQMGELTTNENIHFIIKCKLQYSAC